MQQTLQKEVEISGVGLHSGLPSRLLFKPAKAGSGVVFKRSDMSVNGFFPALYQNVADTRNCTCLGNDSGQVVSTIEHIMAALYALKIDNVEIECNQPEVAIMDGSAKIFYETLKEAGTVTQEALRKVLKVKEKVEFSDEKGNRICLSPSDTFQVHFVIDFPSKIVGHQEFSGEITEDVFANEIAPARTFCEKYQIDYLRSVGLIKGGSLDNAVVLDGENILNEGGFRVEDECVKHKVLDCIGDMFTSGYRMMAKAEAFHTGHFHNNEVLKMLFANKDNYEIIEE